jgi:hypothetical protein
LQPAIPLDYSRDRNIGVAEQMQISPEYRAIGVRTGSFNTYPSVNVIGAATDNVFLNDRNKRSDVLVSIIPTVSTTSDWSVHQVSLFAQGELTRYANNTIRNRNNYLINAVGVLNVSYDTRVVAQYRLNKSAESPYSADLLSDALVVSQYRRSAPTLRIEQQLGRARFIAIAETVSYKFNTPRLEDGSIRDQRERNRTVTRLAAQAEYALSPSIAAYGQVNYDHTGYASLRATGRANQTSNAWSVIGGTNFDLAGLMRGTIGVGYAARNYKSPLYRNARGISFQAQMDFFVSPLTTVSASGQSVFQDSNFGGGQAYRDSRATLKMDHALLRNLLLGASATLADQKLSDTDGKTRLFYGGFTAVYQMNREFEFGGNIQYAKAKVLGGALAIPFSELRGQLSVKLRR